MKNFSVCLPLNSRISTFSTCDTRLSPESARASPCQKDHQHLTPLFPSDLVSGRCYKLKLSFVAAASGTSETGLHAWNAGNSEGVAHHHPVPVPVPPSRECGCLQRKVVLSHVKKNFFSCLFTQCSPFKNKAASSLRGKLRKHYSYLHFPLGANTPQQAFRQQSPSNSFFIH